MAAHDLATWHCTILQITAMCHRLIHPFVSFHAQSTTFQLTFTSSCATSTHAIVPVMPARATCHDMTHPHLHLSMSTPMHLATLVIWPYGLYNQLPCQHCMDTTVNIFFFRLFEEMNRSRYILHTTSV
jgi:hypothetical protein